jgi:hypothetical protein
VISAKDEYLTVIGARETPIPVEIPHVFSRASQLGEARF